MTASTVERYHKGALFLTGKGKIVLYCGNSPKTGEKTYFWVDNAIYSEENGNYNIVNWDIIRSRLFENIGLLISRGTTIMLKETPYSLKLFLGYIQQQSPTLVNFLNGFKDVKTSTNTIEGFKPGYLYKKIKTGETYVYLGNLVVSINSRYRVKGGVRKVHLFMYYTKGDAYYYGFEDVLNSRLGFGYDGNFSINFKKSDVEEVGKVIDENFIPIDKEKVLHL